MDVRRTPAAALEELLLSLFSPGELRRLIYREFRQLSNDLPSEVVAPAELAHQLVNGLLRHGLMDARFFEVLRSERSGRRREVDEVATLFRMAEPAEEEEEALPIQELEPYRGPEPSYASEGVRAVAEHLRALYALLRSPKQAPALRSGWEREASQLERQLRDTPGLLQAGAFLARGRYQLLRRLGQTPFAATWHAWDLVRQRQVAIKTLNPTWSSDSLARSRFQSAVSVMLSLDLPGMVRVLDPSVGDPEVLAFATELMEGGSLVAVLRDGPLTLARAAAVLSAVGRTLARAHALGVTHRGMRPENVLFDGEGRAKLSDFALDRIAEPGPDTSKLVRRDLVYTAPEMLFEDTGNWVKADQYGYAMIAVACLTGLDIPRDVIRDPAAALDRLPEGSPLREVLGRALSVDPSARYPDVAALVTALIPAILWAPAKPVSSALPASAAEVLRSAQRTYLEGRPLDEMSDDEPGETTFRIPSVHVPLGEDDRPPPSTLNPFLPGTPLRTGELPPGRAADAQRLVGRVAVRASAALLGPRRSGKTSLLLHLRRRLSANHRVWMVSLEDQVCRTPDELALAIEPSLKDEARPREALLVLLGREARWPVILIDEVGYLREADLDARPHLFGWLRGLSQRAASVVFAGSPNDFQEVAVRASALPGSSFANDFPSQALGPLAPDDAVTFLATTAPSDVPIPPDPTGRWIHELCGGWPFYLQVMGFAIVDEARSGRRGVVADRGRLRELYERVLLQDWGHVLQQRWVEIPAPARRVVLRALAAAGRLPPFDALSRTERQTIRDARLYDGLYGWVLDNDPPFLDWTRRKLTELGDELGLEDA